MACGAVVGGRSIEGIDVTKEAIIQGQVLRQLEGGSVEPVGNAYVRLLDSTGEFTAEVPTDDAGQFRFFAGEGRWTLRTLAPKADPTDRQVVAQVGSVAEVSVSI